MQSLFFLLAFAAGCAISVQAAVNAQLAIGFGGSVIGAAFYSFATGAIVLGLITISQGSLGTALTALPAQPLWKLIGGLLGAGAIFSTVLLAPRIGLANLLVLVIAGQLITSLIVDHYGLLNVAVRQLTVLKAIGALTVLFGALITLFGDRVLSWLSSN